MHPSWYNNAHSTLERLKQQISENFKGICGRDYSPISNSIHVLWYMFKILFTVLKTCISFG